jgi:hypothetical protein
MKKKILFPVLAGMMLLGLGACGGNSNNATVSTSTSLPEVTAIDAGELTPETPVVGMGVERPLVASDYTVKVTPKIWVAYGVEFKFPNLTEAQIPSVSCTFLLGDKNKKVIYSSTVTIKWDTYHDLDFDESWRAMYDEFTPGWSNYWNAKYYAVTASGTVYAGS